MLKDAKDIKGFRILANDTANETVGTVKDLYFDDERWGVRYLVIDTKAWIFKDLVLLSPYSVSGVDWDEGIIWVNQTKDEIKHAPRVKVNSPVTRNFETSFNNYFKLPQYWSSGLGMDIEGIWAGGFFPQKEEQIIQTTKSETTEELKEEQHLHSMHDLLGFHLRAVDVDSFGTVESAIMDTETWALKYLVINTHKLLPGGKLVLLSPDWVEKIEWEEKKIITDYLRHSIENCPEYDPSVPFDLMAEDELHTHFKKTGYWNLRNWPESPSGKEFEKR